MAFSHYFLTDIPKALGFPTLPAGFLGVQQPFSADLRLLRGFRQCKTQQRKEKFLRPVRTGVWNGIYSPIHKRTKEKRNFLVCKFSVNYLKTMGFVMFNWIYWCFKWGWMMILTGGYNHQLGFHGIWCGKPNAIDHPQVITIFMAGSETIPTLELFMALGSPNWLFNHPKGDLILTHSRSA